MHVYFPSLLWANADDAALDIHQVFQQDSNALLMVGGQFMPGNKLHTS